MSLVSLLCYSVEHQEKKSMVLIIVFINLNAVVGSSLQLVESTEEEKEKDTDIYFSDIDSLVGGNPSNA